MKTSLIRYTVVRLVWKIIDKLTDRLAEKTVLPDGVNTITDIPYENDNASAHTLDVYYPTIGDNHPVVLYIHGGGFIAGDKKQTKPYCMTLAKEGYTVFSINYRLAPDFVNPAQIHDVLAAMAWIEKHGDQYFGDRNRIVFAGDSAGAYLAAFAACICTNNNLAAALNLLPPITKSEIKGVLLYSGLYDLETAAARKFVAIKSDLEIFLGTGSIKSYNNLDTFSVIRQITENFPPAFISSGEVDGLHPESLALVNVLRQHNVNFQALLFDRNEKKAFHCYHQHQKLETSKECWNRVKEFLIQYV